MSRASRRAEIAGAGFAGLVAACALAQSGWRVRVHEASEALRAFGAGIYLWRIGMQVLEDIGALDEMRAQAFAPQFEEVWVDGEQHAKIAVNGAYLTMPRHHLHGVLVAAARRSGVELVTGSEAIAATPDGVLRLADGRALKADLVIGADGVRAGIRKSLGIPATTRRHEDGFVRVLTRRGRHRDGRWDNVLDFWSYDPPGLRLLYSPCGGDSLYLGLMAAADAEIGGVPIDRALWAGRFPELADVIQGIGPEARYDVYATTVAETWSLGRAAIIGDAAHLMPSTLGQGANTAMANALEMVRAIGRADTVEEGLRSWEQRQRPFVERVQAQAEEIAAARSLGRFLRTGRKSDPPSALGFLRETFGGGPRQQV